MKKKYFSQFHHGLMFHRFHKNGNNLSGAGSLSQNQFEEILKLIGIENIISPNEWIEKTKNKTFRDTDVCITFDDGLKSQFTYALPILEKYKLKAFWFIFSSVFKSSIDRNELYNKLIFERYKNQKKFQKTFLKKIKFKEDIFKSQKYLNFYSKNKQLFPFFSSDDIKYRYVRNLILTKQQLKDIMDDLFNINQKDLTQARSLWMNINDLKKINKLGHTIGMHSDTHDLNFKSLSYQNQKKEYMNNYRFIYEVTKTKPQSMSHPLNSYDKNTLKILKNMKIICGFRSTLFPTAKANVSNLEFARNDPAHILRFNYSIK